MTPPGTSQLQTWLVAHVRSLLDDDGKTAVLRRNTVQRDPRVVSVNQRAEDATQE